MIKTASYAGYLMIPLPGDFLACSISRKNLEQVQILTAENKKKQTP